MIAVDIADVIAQQVVAIPNCEIDTIDLDLASGFAAQAVIVVEACIANPLRRTRASIAAERTSFAIQHESRWRKRQRFAAMETVRV